MVYFSQFPWYLCKSFETMDLWNFSVNPIKLYSLCSLNLYMKKLGNLHKIFNKLFTKSNFSVKITTTERNTESIYKRKDFI